MENKLVIKNPSMEGFDPQEGFLTELWQSKKELPRLSGIGKVLYLFREGIRNLAATPASSMISITTVAASVFLLGAIIILIQNVNNSISKAHDSLALTVYFSEDASEAQVNSFLEDFKNNSKVKTVKYISKTDAMAVLKDELGESRDFLDGLDADNPLPRSADLFFNSADVQDLDQIFKPYLSKNIIEDYSHGSPFIASFKRLMKVFGFLAKIGIMISEIVVIFLIANTIKLLIYSRRDEILIMQLIGATDWLIQIPFLISGAAQGILGSLLGLAVLKVAYWAVTFELRSFQFLTTADYQMFFLMPVHMLLIVLMCAAIGCLGSYFSIGKFLNV